MKRRPSQHQLKERFGDFLVEVRMTQTALCLNDLNVGMGASGDHAISAGGRIGQLSSKCIDFA